ncbi:MAG: tRNA (adenosine(37)-N6)-dimethylallyltransferase MiaA [Melioribacteraceae bacterium]|nr:tRNA (adenosine(37)-N6)-dimethylallyltransferase MiaA [Melioribacteraceae bacterium]
MERRVIVIVGATGSGKTSLSLKLAAKLNTEIISADSRQIYKILDIGTAKPLKEELNQIKHHFIDSLNPDEPFNVSKYEDASLKIIDELHQKDKIPIVVGGSGLYIKALVDGLFNEVDTDEEFRRKLIDEREKFGNEYLYQKLIAVDKESANTMLPQNWKRVIRALEVFHLTGEPIWKFHAEHKREVDIEFLQNGLQWERELLYQNINNRVDKMIFDGLVDEVKSILGKGYSSNLNSLNTVGYKEIIAYLNGECDLDRAVELIKRNTRHYAKRQMTWFRKDERIKWFEIDQEEDLEKIADSIIKDIK